MAYTLGFLVNPDSTELDKLFQGRGIHAHISNILHYTVVVSDEPCEGCRPCVRTPLGVLVGATHCGILIVGIAIRA